MLTGNTSRCAREPLAFSEFFDSGNTTGRGGRSAQRINLKADIRMTALVDETMTRITEVSSGTFLYGETDIALLGQLFGQTTGGYLRSVRGPDVVEVREQRGIQPKPSVASIPEKLAVIRSELSLNISELASALRVERPTIYSWIDGTIPHMQNQVRLEKLYAVALSWRVHSNLPLGNVVREKLLNGQSISTLLRQEKIPFSEIEQIFISVKARPDRRMTKEDDHRQLSVREIRAKYEISRSGRSGSREEIEVLSGKRATPE